jgi:hypothetical protein
MKSFAAALLVLMMSFSMPAFSDEPEDMPAFYAKHVSATQVKIYAKDIVGIGKVSLKLNGRELGWVRATSNQDRKLRIIDGTAYLVRTGSLRAGSNQIQVLVDGKVAWSTRLSR